MTDVQRLNDASSLGLDAAGAGAAAGLILAAGYAAVSMQQASRAEDRLEALIATNSLWEVGTILGPDLRLDRDTIKRTLERYRDDPPGFLSSGHFIRTMARLAWLEPGVGFGIVTGELVEAEREFRRAAPFLVLIARLTKPAGWGVWGTYLHPPTRKETLAWMADIRAGQKDFSAPAFADRVLKPAGKPASTTYVAPGIFGQAQSLMAKPKPNVTTTATKAGGGKAAKKANAPKEKGGKKAQNLAKKLGESPLPAAGGDAPIQTVYDPRSGDVSFFDNLGSVVNKGLDIAQTVNKARKAISGGGGGGGGGKKKAAKVKVKPATLVPGGIPDYSDMQTGGIAGVSPLVLIGGGLALFLFLRRK